MKTGRRNEKRMRIRVDAENNKRLKEGKKDKKVHSEKYII